MSDLPTDEDGKPVSREEPKQRQASLRRCKCVYSEGECMNAMKIKIRYRSFLLSRGVLCVIAGTLALGAGACMKRVISACAIFPIA